MGFWEPGLANVVIRGLCQARETPMGISTPCEDRRSSRQTGYAHRDENYQTALRYDDGGALLFMSCFRPADRLGPKA